MRIFFLIHCFLSFILACPPAILNNGTVDGQFPRGTESTDTGGKNCTMTITVPKGYYIKVWFNNSLEAGDSIQIYDNVAVYSTLGVLSPVDVHIQLETSSSGRFNVFWAYRSMGPVGSPNQYLILPENNQGLLVLQATTTSSQVVVRGNESLAIFGDAEVVPDTSTVLQTLQGCFVFAGEGTDGQFLGSLYSLATSGMPILFSTAPYTITLVSYTSGIYNGAFLIRRQAELQSINFSFLTLGDWPYSQNIALTSTEKPTVVTVFDPNIHFGCYLYNQTFSSSGTQLDWLPGSSTPPALPNLSFNQATTIIPPKIPGPLKTFAVSNGAVSFILSSNYPEKLQNLEVGDVAYFATDYYSLENSEQDLFETCFVKGLNVAKVQFTVQKAYARFNITVTDGQVDTNTLSSSDPTVTFSGKGFRMIYMGSNDAKDTGGLLRIEVKSAAFGSHLAALFLPFIVLFCKSKHA